MKKKKAKSFSDIYRSIRRDWGNIHPATKVIPNKKKYKRKEKHRKKDYYNNNPFLV